MRNFRSAASWLCGLFIMFSFPLGTEQSSAGTVSDVVASTRAYAVQTAEAAEEYWNAAVKRIKEWTPGVPSAGDLMGPLEGNENISDTDFRNMMDVAGYSIKSVKAEVGLIPVTVFEFAQKRQISEYDRLYLQRLLRKQKRERSGPIAMAERAIIESVLEIQGSNFYDLTRVDVKLLPLPSISFTAEPKDIVLDPNTSYVVDQIRQVNERLQNIAEN